jgi:hypothetical protein
MTDQARCKHAWVFVVRGSWRCSKCGTVAGSRTINPAGAPFVRVSGWKVGEANP